MFPLSKGKVARQAHVGLPDGTYEEEHGREASDGRASHLYRTHLPTAWVRIEGPLKPRAYDLNGIKPQDLTDAPVDPGVLEAPEPEPHDEEGQFDVRVKRGDEYTTLTYPFHPLDVVGWQGDLCPIRLNIEDFRPVVSPRYHLPPSVHVTFKSDGFEIGTFAPRPTETGDPTALRVPSFHSNIDKD